MKRRILHIITGLETGGAETSLARLVMSTNDDVEHHVLSLTTRGTQAALLELHGAKVTALCWKRGRIGVRGINVAVELARACNPDVIQGWMYHANLVATLVALRLGMRGRLVWSVRHSLDNVADEPRTLRAVIRIGALLSRLPARVLFNSERSRRQHESAGYARSRSAVIANGFDTDRFVPNAVRRARARESLGITPDTLIIGLVARVHPLKDHVTFLECAAKVRAVIPNVRFLLAGRGTDESDGVVATTIARLGLHDSMILLGDRADVEAIYNACDLVTLTSRSEAFPNMVGEAMASGVACVTTDVGDAALIVAETGVVVSPGDINALADAWVSMLAPSAATRHMQGTSARARIVREFSLERNRDAYLALWAQLCSDSSRRGTVRREATARPIRVLHVLTASMSLTFLRGQREYFAARNIDLHVATSPGDELVAWDSAQPGTAHPIAMQRRVSPLADSVALWHLVRLFRTYQFDVVHAGTPKGGLLGMLAALICRVPIRIYHLRGLPLSTATGVQRFVLRASEKMAMAASTQVLSVSESLKAEVHRERLIHPDRVLVVGAGSSNGVDAQRRFNPELVSRLHASDVRANFGIAADALVVGFVGRLTCDKGIVELLDAWRSVRTAHESAHLLVVGIEDDNSISATQAVAGFRADPRVHLHGTDWDTPPLYAAMDVLVLPTYREGFPNVLLEAGAMQLPVVATTVPGCVDAVVHNSTGLLVPARDSAALADAIRRYLSDAALRASHGAVSRRRIVEQFDQQVIWEGFASLYGAAAAQMKPAIERQSSHTDSQQRAA